MELKKMKKQLLEAVSRVIEEEGFTKIGINRIARYDFYSFAYSGFINQVEQVTTSNLRDVIKAVLLKQLEYLKGNQLI